TDCQKNQYFNKKAFVSYLIHGCYCSLIIFFIPWASMNDAVRNDGKDIVSHPSFAFLLQTCLLIVVHTQLSLDTYYWTAVNHFFVWLSTIGYFAISVTMYSNGMFYVFPSSFPLFGAARNTLNQPNVWLTIFLTFLLCILPVVAFRFIFIQLRPTINDKTFLSSIRRSTRSGYAFSHSQGYGDLVTSRKFLIKRPLKMTALFTQTDSSIFQNQPQHYRTIVVTVPDCIFSGFKQDRTSTSCESSLCSWGFQ
uniref:P-type ATPase C-terminal domain-containing protein n=1 Tax=Haplochromis burtoni TaxID=8153 RepID=A0A3Q3C0Z3_HAPBU